MATKITINKTPLWRLNALELVQGYAEQTLSPVAVCEALLARIEELNPELNAFVFLAEDCLEQARSSEARWQAGQPLSKLDGVPLAIKDSLNVRDMPTSWGNAALAELRQENSEWALERCEQAGLILLGKTNVPELTLDGVTRNPTFGATRNPWNPEHTPGGSSGGTVAAVAAGMTPLGLGTDGGGSIRRPCAHTGLLGLKPTSERIPRTGGLPRIMMDFEVLGPVARDHRDLQAIFEIISPEYQAPGSNRPLKILLVTELDKQPVEPEIQKATIAYAEQLKIMGHSIHHGDLPLSLDAFQQLWPILGEVAVASAFKAFPQMRASSQEKFRKMALRGEQRSAVEWMQAWETVTAFRSQVKALFREWDLVLTPSIAALAWSVEKDYPERIDKQEVGSRGHAVFTGWVNMAGNPALNLPAGLSDNGATIGVQLIADWHQEEMLLAISEQLHQIRPHWQWPDQHNAEVVTSEC